MLAVAIVVAGAWCAVVWVSPDDVYRAQLGGGFLFISRNEKYATGDPMRPGFHIFTHSHGLNFKLVRTPDAEEGSAGEAFWLIPIWPSVPLLLAPTLYLWYLDRRPRSGHCRQCGYNLTGNQSGHCPECGAPVASGRATVRSS